MTEKDRVKRCIHFKETDSVPWQIDCTSGMARIIMENCGIVEENRRVQGSNIFRYSRLHDFFGNHLCYVRCEAPDSTVEVAPGLWRDEWGVFWDRRIDRDVGAQVNTVLEQMRIEEVEVPDPCSASRYAHFAPIIEHSAHRYVIAKISRCLFERAWSLRGMASLLVDFIENPSFVHELFELITEFDLQIIDALEPFPIDAIRFSDDWGGQLGMLMSPETWRSFIKPYLGRLYGRAHERGYDVFIHCCGNILDVLDDLIEIGVNVFNPVQPETMDVEEVIGAYAGRLAFYGGLSIQHTLPFGTPEEVREEVGSRVQLAREHGGYIVAPAHDMPPDIPLENIDAMLDVLQHQ